MVSVQYRSLSTSLSYGKKGFKTKKNPFQVEDMSNPRLNINKEFREQVKINLAFKFDPKTMASIKILLRKASKYGHLTVG